MTNGRRLDQLAIDLGRAVRLAAMAAWWFAWPLARYLLGRPSSEDEIGVLLRTFCERMGVTYTKIGQYLAMRSDVLPPEVCRELGRLFESAPPIPVAVAQAIVAGELGDVASLFRSFEASPIASASIAQVHRAVTADGTVVAVKVQRPGIARAFASDMRNLRRFAQVLDATGVTGRTSTVSLIDEISEATMREMDFVLEGRMADRLRRTAIRADHIPRVYWDLTTARVLTLDYVDGVSLLRAQQLVHEGRTDELSRLLPGVAWQRVGADLTHACMHQMVGVGLFHGDPHPGNVLIRPDGSFAFVDFGIVGELTPADRRLMRQYISNTVSGNLYEAWRAWLRLAPPTPGTDLIGYRRESMQILANWHAASTRVRRDGDPHLGYYQNLIIDTLRRYQVPLPPDHLLFWRALLMLDVIALQPPLALDLFPLLRGFFAGLDSRAPSLAQRLTEPSALPRRLAQLGSSAHHARRAIAALIDPRRRWRGRSPWISRHDATLQPRALPLVACSLAILAVGTNVPPVITITTLAAVAVLLAVSAIGIRSGRNG